MQNPSRLAVLLAALGLSLINVLGQSGAPKASASPEAPAVVSPNSAPQAVDNRTYEIGVLDTLKIEVYQDQNMSRMVVVRPDGKFSMPMIGDVQADGLTPEHLKKNLTDALSTLYQSPDVTVSVMDVRSKSFRITGQVNRPGPYFLVVPIRVNDAIIDAGGFREDWVNKKKIIIMRGSQRIPFNAVDFEKGKNLESNIWLQPNDVVMVPK